MLNYVVRFLTYFKEECLGLKRVTVAPYPFDYSMREYLPKAYSPFFAIQFARDISKSLEISFTEVEIIMFLISEWISLPLDDILTHIDHVSEDHIKKSLRNLVNKGYLYKTEYPGNETYYGIMLELRDDIGSYYKD